MKPCTIEVSVSASIYWFTQVDGFDQDDGKGAVLHYLSDENQLLELKNGRVTIELLPDLARVEAHPDDALSGLVHAVVAASKIRMKPQGDHGHRPAISVVCRVDDTLQVERCPRLGIERILQRD